MKQALSLALLLLLALFSSCSKNTEATISYAFRLENTADYDQAVINLDFFRAIVSEAGGNKLVNVPLGSKQLSFDLNGNGSTLQLGSATIEESTILGYDFAFDDATVVRNGISSEWEDPLQSTPEVREAFNISNGQQRRVTFVLDLAASDSVAGLNKHYFNPKLRLEVE